MKAIKIKVPDPQTSEKIQKLAFKRGHEWSAWGKEKTPISLDAPYLFIGEIEGWLGHSYSIYTFARSEAKEVSPGKAIEILSKCDTCPDPARYFYKPTGEYYCEDCLYAAWQNEAGESFDDFRDYSPDVEPVNFET
jgi:hypothetical protein